MPRSNFKEAEPSGLSKASVHTIAENVATQLSFQPGGDLNEALQRLGGKLVIKDFWDLEDTESGSIDIHAPGQFDIFVSNLTSGLRDRFTIAHEIGHYVLHYIWPRNNGEDLTQVTAKRYGSSRLEWEANWFAAAFLMPEASFRAFHEQAGGNLTLIASHFGVSQRAAEVRAQSLEL